MDNEEGGVLMACVADGAGSSRFSDQGSSIASRIIYENVSAHVEAHQGLSSLNRDDAVQWCEHAKRALQEKADAQGCELREFATTLCVAILSGERSIFFQIGDGAIILRKNGIYGVVFWPHSGEYANMTNFLTADNFQNQLEFLATSDSFSDVALFTDGIERIALDFGNRTPFGPFFDPLLSTLRAAESSQDLGEDLRRLLQSDPVRNRSDDDKTLIVASRCSV